MPLNDHLLAGRWSNQDTVVFRLLSPFFLSILFSFCFPLSLIREYQGATLLCGRAILRYLCVSYGSQARSQSIKVLHEPRRKVQGVLSVSLHEATTHKPKISAGASSRYRLLNTVFSSIFPVPSPS